MSVVPLTLTISLCLVFTFVIFFLREQSRRSFGSAESDALMPLADEIPRTGSEKAPLVMDLGGRLPRQRRTPCNHEHHNEKRCDGCERQTCDKNSDLS